MSPEAFGPDLFLVQKLAAGGMAEVFRARQTGVGGFEKTVAVKRILPNFAQEPHFKEMFREEVNLCAQFQHPNVVQVFSNGEKDGYLFLVMEFIRGQNLAGVLKASAAEKTPIPTPVVAYIVTEAAKGLDYAHRFADENGRPHDVIHRDVSPQNVMVSYDGHVKVVDFGIAKAADRAELTAPGKIKGKVAYMSPEQISGRKLTPRSDVYSLGIVLWELLTMRRLYKADNPVATMNMVMSGEVSPPSKVASWVDPALDPIVLRALAFESDQRYPSARDLARDLGTFLSAKYPNFMEADMADYMKKLFRAEINRVTEEARNLSADLPTITPSSNESQRPSASYRTAERRSLSIDPSVGAVDRPTVPVWLVGVLVVLTLVGGIALMRSLQSKQRALLPNAVSGLIGWFDAESLRVGEGASIARWRDEGAMHWEAVQAEPQHQPTFTRHTKHGLPAVLFAGDKFLTCNELARAFRRADGMTLMTVARFDPRPDKHFFLALQGPDRLRDSLRVGFASGGRIRLKASPMPGPPYVDSEPGIVVPEWAIYTFSVGVKSVIVYINGEERLSAALEDGVNFYDAAHLSLGQEWDAETPTDFLYGDVSEILIFDRQLHEDERKGLEMTLSERFQIALED